MNEVNTHKDIKILFRESDQKDNVLHHGTMDMKTLYNSDSMVWVKNACGDLRYVSRRDFHVIDDSPANRPKAIVCDIDGVLNFIPTHVNGTTHRDQIMLEDGTACQWTELNLSATAKHNLMMFELLKHYSKLGYAILLLTARGETQRIQSERWLKEGFDKVKPSTSDILTMHPNGRRVDFTMFMRGWSANDLAAPAMKAQMMQSCILPNYDVEYFIEDCPKNVAAMRQACPEIKIMQIHG